MPVKIRYRKILSGVVRAQTVEAVAVGKRLLRANSINPSLGLFPAPGHTGDAATFEFIVNYWISQLAALKQV